MLWKVINVILTFLINILLVRLLGAEQSGLFYYAITLMSLLVLLQSFSLESGIVYHGSKYSVSGISLFLFPWLLIQLFIAIVLLHFFTPGHFNKLAAVVYVVSNLAILFCTGLYNAQKKMAIVNFILCLVNLLLLLSLTFLYFFNPFFTFIQSFSGLAPAVFFYICSFLLQAVLLLFLFFYSTEKNSLTASVNTQKIKSVFSFSAIAFSGNILIFLALRVDYFIVEKYCTAVSLSNYIQVSKLGQLLVLLPSVLATVVFPYTAGAQHGESYMGKTQFFCRVITAWFILFALFIAAAGYWLFPFLFGAAFTQMYVTLLLYLPGFLSLCVLTVLAAYLAGAGFVKINLIAAAITLFVVIAVDILLIPLWGINGAAMASSVAYTVCLLYTLRHAKRKLKGDFYNFFVLEPADIKVLADFLFKKKRPLFKN